MPRAASPTPSRSKQRKALGPSWMPAPISPSWLAFSSTSEAMFFWPSASAAARPPMPPPAIRILSGPTDHLLVMQPGDLVRRQAENIRKDLVGMLAERRGGRGRRALDRAKLPGRRRHGIAADAGLREPREHRVVEHRLLVMGELAERLVRRPQCARLLERPPDLGRRALGPPRAD